MPTELILVRHCETAWNRERRMQGQTDTPLSSRGVAQAEALGQRFLTIAFDALYSSDLKRAQDTALAISRSCGKPVGLDPGLRERTFGIFEGLTYEEIKLQYADLHVRFFNREADFALPGAESPRQFYERSLACLEAIAQKHEGKTVVVVTHGMVLDTLYRASHQLALEKKREAPLLNASLNRFRYDSGRWVELVWADVAHLSEVGFMSFESRSN